MHGWGRGGVGHALVGWGGSCRGGVGWVMHWWGGVGHAMVGWGGSCRGGVGHSRSKWVKIGTCYSYLSQMQNDANLCDMSLYKVLFGVGGGVGGVMHGWGGSGRGGVGHALVG